jgi:hypothetical protein
MPFPVTPVILTCERDLATMQRFVQSFLQVRWALRPPVVLIDQSRSPQLSARYLSLVAAMKPGAVYVHAPEPGLSAYDSVQAAANLALEWGLRNAAADDYLLFIEDDIVFSSHFPRTVTTTYLGPETGFLTLYLPDNGYGRGVIDPEHFYGTQCVLFTRKAAEEIVTGRDEMMTKFMPGYDIRWSRFLAHKGYVLYSFDRSYVQHLPGHSRLHGGGSHVSRRFLP